MSEIYFVPLADVLEMHKVLVERYGGEDGIRDMNLLQSALAMPQSGIGGEYFHSDIYEMAAAYLYHVVMNHPFADGNKRTGLAVAGVFLDINGHALTCANPALYDMIIDMIAGKLDKMAVADFFKKNTCKNRDIS